MLKLAPIALLLATSLAAQTLPNYTFGNGFGSGMPGLYSGGNGLNTNAWPSIAQPGGFYGGNQSPFLTMPSYPFATPTLGNAGSATSPQTGQPQPYWMQTPQPSGPQAQYIDAVPSAPRPAPQARPQSAPPRWAPLSGQLPRVQHRPQSGNNWRFSPVATPQSAASPPVSTPPKWHTE